MAMNLKTVNLVAAIALLSLTACQTPQSPNATAEPAPPDTTVAPPDRTVAPPADLAEGVSLSADGQTLILTSGSIFEAYCNGGQGALAISAVGEAGGDFQVLSCGPTFAAFDAARANGFAGVIYMAPVVADGALRLQDGEYTKVQCLADHAGLAPALSDESDGHMNLECI